MCVISQTYANTDANANAYAIAYATAYVFSSLSSFSYFSISLLELCIVLSISLCYFYVCHISHTYANAYANVNAYANAYATTYVFSSLSTFPNVPYIHIYFFIS